MLIGESPVVYPQTEDKLAVMLAYLTNLIVPYGQIVVFFLPFLIMWWRKWKFSPRNIIIAIIIGGLLAWGTWWLDWWILALGQAAAFNAIYGN